MYLAGEWEGQEDVVAFAQAAEESHQAEIKREVDELQNYVDEEAKKETLREGFAQPTSVGPQPEPEGEEAIGSAGIGLDTSPQGSVGGAETGDGGSRQVSQAG